MKGNNAIDRLIARFSPSMPKKGHNRIVVARLTGNENFFDRFIKRMEKLDAGDIWAMIIDITQIDTRNRRKLHDDLPRFTDYNTERKLPSSIRFSLEQAIDFGRAEWGALVKGFEMKDLLINMGHGKLSGEESTELREKIVRFNSMLKRGRHLSDHMRTHFKHNDFIVTLLLDDIDIDHDTIDDIIAELSLLDVVKFRVDAGMEREKEPDQIQIVKEILGKKGKQLLEDEGRAGGRSEIHLESMDV